MYILKETIRYNGETYKAGQKVDFNAEDLKEISMFVEEIKGEPVKKVEIKQEIVEKPVIEEVKEDKIKSAKKSTKK